MVVESNPSINPNDSDWQAIQQLMAQDDFRALGQKIQLLMRMPQSLCKMRGNCCRVATFKGSLSYEDIKALAQSDDPDAQNASDFATLFVPYASQAAVREFASEFVDRVRAAHSGDDPDAISFFKCRFLADDGRCLVHEDRPTGCRAYPFPHAKTIYHPGCGFEQRSQENLAKIGAIQTFFERRLAEMDNG